MQQLSVKAVENEIWKIRYENKIWKNIYEQAMNVKFSKMRNENRDEKCRND